MESRSLKGHTHWVYCCGFSPDGSLGVSGSGDRTLRLWRTADGIVQRQLTGHTGAVFCCGFSPDGSLVVSGSADRTLRLWRTADGILQRQLTGHIGAVFCCGFSPDGSLVVSGSGDRTLRLWRTADGILQRQLTGHTDVVLCCGFSPDGSLVVSGSDDKTLKLWRTADGILQRQLTGHTGVVLCCGFSPDGSLVVSGSDDKTLKLWRTADGILQRQLTGHTDAVLCCGFSPDGSLVVSGSDDKTLKLWRTADGSLQRQLNGHTDSVWCCGFSPDGSLVVSGSDDKTLKLWRTADGSLQQGVACQSRRRTRSQGALVGADQQLVEVRGELRKASAELQSAKSRKVEVEQAFQKSELQRAWLLAAQLLQPSQYLEYDIVVLPTSSPLWRLLSGLFVGSAAKHRRDLRSADFCEAPALEVEQIRSVVNPRLLQSYLAELDSILGKHRGGCTAIPELEHLRLPPGLFRPDLNEHLLFHGALPEIIEKICKGGFDPRRGGEGVGAMFGTATYFAINASKSDIYTEEFARRRQRSTQRTMIVARVALGAGFRTCEPQKKWSRPPDGPDGLPFDSVWAANTASGGCVDHVEVMIYDKSQAMPMFLVDYRHTEQCRCAECLKRPQ
ncbi:unnamed protein product [Polarella glacialis]|uniref:Poly [ADP-ribose] polymerase n=1 Tax=Polarella glacialis TaxID=89957 RepID=A0A813E245_POLGL|nr:unnamed protein product [Polarella glacialis]